MGLILPASYVIHGKQPKYRCALCGHPFFEGEERAYERHVVGHPLEDVQEHSPRHQAPGLFGPDAGDAEWARWIRDHQASDPHGWRRWMLTGAGKNSTGTGDG